MKSTITRLLAGVLAVGLATGAHAQLPDLGDVLDGGGVPDPGEILGGGGGNLLPPAVEEALPEGLRQPAPPRTVVIDHAAALRAVRDHRALPLDDLMKGVARAYRGEVIDVQLIGYGELLLYQVKVLEPRGRISVLYFNAANGAPARPPPG
jgi:hypothetical protein